MMLHAWSLKFFEAEPTVSSRVLSQNTKLIGVGSGSGGGEGGGGGGEGGEGDRGERGRLVEDYSRNSNSSRGLVEKGEGGGAIAKTGSISSLVGFAGDAVFVAPDPLSQFFDEE